MFLVWFSQVLLFKRLFHWTKRTNFINKSSYLSTDKRSLYVLSNLCLFNLYMTDFHFHFSNLFFPFLIVLYLWILKFFVFMLAIQFFLLSALVYFLQDTYYIFDIYSILNYVFNNFLFLIFVFLFLSGHMVPCSFNPSVVHLLNTLLVCVCDNVNQCILILF